MRENPPVLGSIDMPPFRIDLGAGLLWHGTKSLSLRPKAWTVLLYLVRRPGLLVSRNELQEAVWPDAEVCDDAVTQSIAALRRALRDDVHRPRFIETVHRRGYRFVGAVTDTVATARRLPLSAPTLVSRDREIGSLFEALHRAETGNRQLAFVIGEPGIGKTSLVDAFLCLATQQSEPHWAARGQSVEHYGEHEPFGPLIEALDRLVSGPVSSAVLPILRRVSPKWYAELVAGHPPGDTPAAAAPLLSWAPRLRDIVAAIEAVTADRTLVLVLEDLQWADPSTIDAISTLAQRTEHARLLIIATYRPAEAAVRDHPVARLRPTLQQRGRCLQIVPEPLRPDAIQTYLATRFTDLVRCDEIAAWLYRRTEGNPLFIVTLVDYLLGLAASRGSNAPWPAAIAGALDTDIPDTLRGTIEAQLDTLAPKSRCVLEAASAVGLDVDAQCVAAVLEASVDETDAILSSLARAHGLLEVATDREWPDGSVGGRYRFRHILYEQTLYAHLAPAVRRNTHERIAKRLEAGFGERVPEVAAELAYHFERGGDRPRAFRHLVLGAARALERAGLREASSLLDTAEQILVRLPPSIDHDRDELALMNLRVIVLSVTGGWAADGLETVLDRCRKLAIDLNDDAQLFAAVRALWYLHGKRGEVGTTWALVDELRRLATRLEHRCTVLTEASVGTTALWAGDIERACGALERVEAEMATGRLQQLDEATDHGVAPFIEALSNLSHALWLAGNSSRAREVRRASIVAAERLAHPLTLAVVLQHAALSSWLCGDTEETEACACRGLELAAEHGLDETSQLLSLFRGAALVHAERIDEGLAMAREGFARYMSTTARLVSPMVAAFADSCLRAGQIHDGLAVVERALDSDGSMLDHMFDAELWRLKGELLAARSRGGTRTAGPSRKTRDLSAAAECLERALTASRHQNASGVERRVAKSLARLRQARGDLQGARDLLAPIVATSEEGAETPDQGAAALLRRELD